MCSWQPFGLRRVPSERVIPLSADASRAWLTTAVQVLLVLLAAASVLELWGINIAGAATGLGVLGAGLAIAMQDFIQNLMAGLTNAGERRFRRGDWVQAGGIEGVIEHIHLRSTVVMGFDRVPRHVPNSVLSNEVLLNKSRIDHWRVYWTVQLVRSATDAQVDQVCELVMTHIRSCGRFHHRRLQNLPCPTPWDFGERDRAHDLHLLQDE
jgi:MscS family membrane protein